MIDIAVLIPAAGHSSRFGRCKQLQPVAGKPMLQLSVDRANAVAPGAVFVVTGAEHEAIAAVIEDATMIHNPASREGLGRSIACGVDALARDYKGILILLADQIAVTADDLLRLREKFDGANIVCARYRQRRGVPALFCQDSFSWLRNLTGERGAQPLLYADRFPLCEIPLENAALDIDTPHDLDGYLGLKQR
jgi:molybdenum cofactor cytidylyltransferase